MRAIAVLAAILAATPALAGCLDASPTSGDVEAATAIVLPGWADRAIPYGPQHDHYDLSHHANLTTPNFEVLGWDPLVSPSKGKTPGGYFCGEIATREDGRRLAVVNSYNTDVAFAIADVTDPAAPVMLGEYVLPYTMVYDVAMTPDGMHVAVATNVGDSGPDEGATATAPPQVKALQRVQPMWRDACTGETRKAGPEQTLPMAPMTLLIGIADPASPVFEDFQLAPILGVHSVASGVVNNRTMIGSSITNLVHAASYYQFFEVSDTPVGARLVLQSVYQTPAAHPETTPIVNGHVDVSFQKHPVTGQELAYLADWDAGMIILDITDPRVPRELGRFSEFTGGGSYMTGVETGNLHETLPIDGLWDGRHYVLAGQEILNQPAEHPTGWVWIVDDTDPTQPTLVGKWTLPVEVEWERTLQFSTHYVEVVNRTMFVSLYHGGVWAVDLSTPENLAAPPTVGVFVPDRVSPAPPAVGPSHGVEGTPTVLDVLAYPNGDLVVFDASSGVYVVRFDATMAVPAVPAWTSG